jgi:YHS domain-containing protein
MSTLLYFLILAGLFALMMRFGCGAHVMGRHGGHSGSHSESQPDSHGKAVDPVCGMTVDPETALSILHAGQTYYFCSESCRGKFEAAPGRYAQAASGASPASPQRQMPHH